NLRLLRLLSKTTFEVLVRLGKIVVAFELAEDQAFLLWLVTWLLLVGAVGLAFLRFSLVGAGSEGVIAVLSRLHLVGVVGGRLELVDEVLGVAVDPYAHGVTPRCPFGALSRPVSGTRSATAS